MKKANCITPNAQFKHTTFRGVMFSKVINLWRRRLTPAAFSIHRRKNICTTAKQAGGEETRPIWDVPENWRY